MKIHLLVFLSCFTVYCNAQSTEQELNPKEFANKVKMYPSAAILDVRTPEEFNKEHLDKAVNINWRDPEFLIKVAEYDKTKPLMVYCLSGGRSKQAADKLRELGFKEVYEMQGGIMKWKADGLSENKSGKWTGMSRGEYDSLLNSPKLVLVDFYAEWCGPCKKMEPYLNELKTELSKDVTIIQVDAEKHSSILPELKIEALPVFYLYKDKKIIWQHSGFISREDLLSQLGKRRDN